MKNLISGFSGNFSESKFSKELSRMVFHAKVRKLVTFFRNTFYSNQY